MLALMRHNLPTQCGHTHPKRNAQPLDISRPPAGILIVDNFLDEAEISDALRARRLGKERGDQQTTCPAKRQFLINVRRRAATASRRRLTREVVVCVLSPLRPRKEARHSKNGCPGATSCMAPPHFCPRMSPRRGAMGTEPGCRSQRPALTGGGYIAIVYRGKTASH